jgi:hypothetical protein
VRLSLEHDPEKWTPVFGQDHAPKIYRDGVIGGRMPPPPAGPGVTAGRGGSYGLKSSASVSCSLVIERVSTSALPSVPGTTWNCLNGKASAPYEFGVKASIVTTNARAPGGSASKEPS